MCPSFRIVITKHTFINIDKCKLGNEGAVCLREGKWPKLNKLSLSIYFNNTDWNNINIDGCNAINEYTAYNIGRLSVSNLNSISLKSTDEPISLLALVIQRSKNLIKFQIYITNA